MSLLRVFLVISAFLILSSYAESCEADDQCDPPFEICYLPTKTCRHKSIWPFTTIEMIGSLALFVVCLLSAAAGIGGGGNIVPILSILFMFGSTESVAYSNWNIFVASIARYIINFNVKHPLKNSVLIDYEIVMLMMPTTLIGASIGIQLNIIFPDLITLILLTLVLLFMGFKTLSQSL
jgi:uncharacterized membrane protein YfcA